MNSVNIIGRLIRDPNVKKTEVGLTVCDLRLAIDDPKSAEDHTDFISVTVYGSQGDLCERYMRKGFIAGVSGHIHTDSYTDADGFRQYPVKVVADRVSFLQWPDHGEKRQEGE